jgi:hypothetical protein
MSAMLKLFTPSIVDFVELFVRLASLWLLLSSLSIRFSRLSGWK